MNNQAAVLYAPHDIRIEERPVPKPGPREVLVEIRVQKTVVFGSTPN